MSDFEGRIRQMLELRGVRQTDLAEAMGVSRSRVTKIITGGSPPHNLIMWAKAARFLWASVEWLALGDGPAANEALKRDLDRLSPQDVEEIRTLVDVKLKQR